MIVRTLALLLPLAFSTPIAPTAPPQESNLAALVSGEIDAAPGRDLEPLFQRAIQLRGAATLGEKGELDRLLDERLRAQGLEPKAVLLVATSRLLGESPDANALHEALAPLVDSTDGGVAAAAAELLGDPLFKGVSPRRRDALAAQMLTRAEDAALAPGLRLDFARAAYHCGGGKERMKAGQILRTFLDSEDAELKGAGALALAELDAAVLSGTLRDTLEQLSKVPDARGQLAAAYLEREKMRRENDRVRTDLLKNKDGQPPEIKEFLTVLALIKQRHLEGQAVDTDKLIEAAINGMLGYMDPFSNLFPSEQYARFFGELEGEYGGIGAYVNEDNEDKLFTIVKPIYSGPAYRQGLMTDDKIVRIGNWQTLGQKVDDIIKHLKGKPGTSVDLYVWRHGMDPQLIERPTDDMKVTVTRESVRIPPGTFQMLPGGIGLLQLDEFSQVSMDEARKWIPQMLAQGMKAMILDLRFNGGGLLTEAREVAELFLKKGSLVVTTEGPNGRKEDALYTDDEQTILPQDMPLVVLVGGATASAAEIVSGALQDNHRATLVGRTTYGKGSVQQLIQILPELEDHWVDEPEPGSRTGNGMRDPWEKLTLDRDGDGEMDYSPRVKLTVARYLLPSGRSIHRELNRDNEVINEGGVEPDVKIDPASIEGWRLREQRKILRAAREHVASTYADNRELYGRLALNDMKRPELYPGFDDFMASLETPLDRDDVRRVLRLEVRRKVQDDRGAEFPTGDFVEDTQVQKAMEVALEKLGKKPEDVQELGQVFDVPPARVGSDVRLADRDSSELRRALSLLRDARTGGKALSGEDVDRLIEILGTIDTRKN